jgi:hypothetical protein
MQLSLGDVHSEIQAARQLEAATGMPQACLWLSIGAACGGAFVGGLVVLLMARL